MFRRLQVCAVHENIALDHAVVELALFVRRSAEAALELRVAGQHQRPPSGGEGAPRLAEGAVQRLRLLPLQQPLAVGRVGDQLAVGAVTVEAGGIRHLEADAVVHAGLAGVVTGDVDGPGVDVAAPYIIVAVELPVLGLVRRVQPALRGQEGPLLGIEPAVQAGGAVFGDEGGLDGDGAAAAERVAERVFAPVAAQRHQRRRQRLPQGRFHAHGAVATLIQALAGGVQADGHIVLHDGEADLMLRPRLRELGYAVVGGHAVHHRLFDDALTGGDGVELGVDGVALHGEGGVQGQVFLPGHGLRALEQLLEAAGGEAGQHGDDPCAAAQVHVEAGAVCPSALAEDAAIFRLDIGKAQALDLVGYQFFQAQQAGDDISDHINVPRCG